ncbi:MAG: UDP-4-amino-4-deoxy-L-arabinose aminotransferase [Acidobacteria bacterium]|nr:UDP-4-amino-4-deoxy-L-arabinose aminotransferase [Acidobacteriota bacterium]
MRKEFLPFARPAITDADIREVDAVLRSGWITTGPKVRELEAAFCRMTGASGAVAVSSATGGMHVTLKALNIAPGDEVITPSMTWVSTVNLIVLCGATPVFVDVDRDTLMTSAGLIAEKITSKTKAIIPVHYAGASLDLHPIRKLAAVWEIPLIEDAAHAAGTRYRETAIGNRGTAIFSFHPIKNMTTGEGGLVVSDNVSLLERIRRLKFHGLGVDAYDRTAQGRSPQAEVLEPGFKYNLPDMNAVLGLAQLDRLDSMNRKRSELVAHYHDRLAGVEEIIPAQSPDYPHTHAWHLFIVRIDTDKAGMDREIFMEELKRRNIGTGIHFRAVHLHKYYREVMGFSRGLLPDTEWNSDRILSLPLFPDMTEADVDDVVDAVKDVLVAKVGGRK